MMFLNAYVKTKVFVADMRSRISERISDETGAVAAEYGLLIALIAVVIAVGAAALGLAINAKFNDVSGSIAGS